MFTKQYKYINMYHNTKNKTKGVQVQEIIVYLYNNYKNK